MPVAWGISYNTSQIRSFVPESGIKGQGQLITSSRYCGCNYLCSCSWYLLLVHIKGRDKQLHPRDTVGCNYLSLLLIPASGTTLPHDSSFYFRWNLARSKDFGCSWEEEKWIFSLRPRGFYVEKRLWVFYGKVGLWYKHIRYGTSLRHIWSSTIC